MLGRIEHFEEPIPNIGMLNFFFVLVLLVANVVLLNLIISLISDTYTTVKTRYEAYRRIDRLNLTLEHIGSLSPAQRSKLECETRWLHILTNSTTTVEKKHAENHLELMRRIDEQDSTIAEQREIIQEHAKAKEEQRKLIDKQCEAIDLLVREAKRKTEDKNENDMSFRN